MGTFALLSKILDYLLPSLKEIKIYKTRISKTVANPELETKLFFYLNAKRFELVFLRYCEL